VSVDAPVVAVVFGSVTPPQGDVVELRVHLGCTREVSSFEALLQNWSGKYSANSATPISVGLDGSISVGRGASCPLLMTCRVESVKYESTPVESYVRVSGRCWGKRLFRRVVTKTYENKKGEEIVKDLLDYYVGLSHVRGGTELVEATDTTYTRLEYQDTPVIDILQYVAESADKASVISYDFRVAPDGKFEFFPRNSKASVVSLSEKIEQSEYGMDIHRVRNRVTVYGVADKSVPLNKDEWTESLTPTDGAWTATSGTVSFDAAVKVKGVGSIKTAVENLSYGGCLFTLGTGKEVDATLFPVLNLWLSRESAFNGNVTLTLFDAANHTAGHEFTVGYDKWFQTQVRVGVAAADVWQVESSFDWTQIKKMHVVCWFDGSATGSFWVDGLFFGGRRYGTVQEDAASQSSYGLRELVEVDEELWSDAECMSRAQALLSSLKSSAEQLTLRSTVLDYGTTPLLAGDTIHVALPNEDVDGDFRILSVEYYVDAKTQTLETALELGREQPLLADYMFKLKSKTDSLSRYKLART
jgi:hypothetical protein